MDRHLHSLKHGQWCRFLCYVQLWGMKSNDWNPKIYRSFYWHDGRSVLHVLGITSPCLVNTPMIPGNLSDFQIRWPACQHMEASVAYRYPRCRLDWYLSIETNTLPILCFSDFEASILLKNNSNTFWLGRMIIHITNITPSTFNPIVISISPAQFSNVLGIMSFTDESH